MICERAVLSVMVGHVPGRRMQEIVQGHVKPEMLTWQAMQLRKSWGALAASLAAAVDCCGSCCHALTCFATPGLLISDHCASDPMKWVSFQASLQQVHCYS